MSISALLDPIILAFFDLCLFSWNTELLSVTDSELLQEQSWNENSESIKII